MYRIYLSIITFVVLLSVSCTAQAVQSISVGEQPHNAAADTVVILGDSNIWLAGDSCTNRKGWVTWFRESWAPASCLSYARSGASWTNTSATVDDTQENIAVLGDNNVIHNQVTRLIEAVDSGRQSVPTLILVAAGGNDAWFAHKRPGEFTQSVDEAFACSDEEALAALPSQTTSLAGSVRLGCLRLKRAFPDATIVLLTPMQMVKVDDEMMTRVSDIIEQSGKKLGLSTIRLDGVEPISRIVEMESHTKTYDGVHTNETGAAAVADFVVERLKPLLGVE